VREAFSHLRGTDGVWKQFQAPYALNDDINVRIFFNYDQSKKAGREAGAARALRRILNSDFPSAAYRLVENSTILADGKPLARICAPSPDEEPRIQYVEKTLLDLKIDKNILKEKFETGAYKPVSEDAWLCL
jgi:hypothetical protein